MFTYFLYAAIHFLCVPTHVANATNITNAPNIIQFWWWVGFVSNPPSPTPFPLSHKCCKCKQYSTYSKCNIILMVGGIFLQPTPCPLSHTCSEYNHIINLWCFVFFPAHRSPPPSALSLQSSECNQYSKCTKYNTILMVGWICCAIHRPPPPPPLSLGRWFLLWFLQCPSLV